jgi:regulator of protease activity HflC (stomatin/prohibitin superfamily)
MNMKKQRGNALAGLLLAVIVILVIGYGLLWVFGTRSVTADNGEEVVLIDKPYWFGDKGVRPTTMKTGDRQIVWWTTDAFGVVVTPVTQTMKFEDLSTKDGTFLDFDTSITIRVTDARGLIASKGQKWFENSLAKPWMSTFRELIKLYTVEELLQDTTVMVKIEAALLKTLNDRVVADGLAVTISDFNMGQGRPNKLVIAQMDETSRAVQAATTWAKEQAAQIARKAAETARGDADSAYALKMGYSPEQVVQMAAITAYSKACEKDGAKCVIMAPGATPVIGLGK